jgi:hypothetical protein
VAWQDGAKVKVAGAGVVGVVEVAAGKTLICKRG